jgi:hypothetical protein
MVALWQEKLGSWQRLPFKGFREWTLFRSSQSAIRKVKTIDKPS